MTYFASLVLMLSLAGIFSAVANLLLPHHLSGIGRVVKALSATVVLFFIASPLMGFLSNAEETMASLSERFCPADGEVTGGSLEQTQSIVTKTAGEALCQKAQELLEQNGFTGSFYVCPEYVSDDTGINLYGVVIYYSDETFDGTGACALISQVYDTRVKAILKTEKP